MIFSKLLQGQGHTRGFLVGEADEQGWEILEEEDSRIVKQTRLHDWHRVERAIVRFMAEAVRLRDAGWTEMPVSLPPEWRQSCFASGWRQP